MTTTTDSTNTPNQGTSIDEALGQTEFGGWIAQNKVPVLSAVILIIVGVFAFGGYRHMVETKNNEGSNALYSVVSTNLPLFEKGSLSAEDFSSKFMSEWESVGHFEGGVSFAIEVSDALRAKNKYELAHNIMMKAAESTSSPQALYFVHARAAVLAEDLGKKEMAIDHLNKILSSGAKYLEGKVYLDLGRLYRESGDLEKAKTSFEWVVEKGKEAEFKKVARLYLEEMAQ